MFFFILIFPGLKGRSKLSKPGFPGPGTPHGENCPCCSSYPAEPGDKKKSLPSPETLDWAHLGKLKHGSPAGQHYRADLEYLLKSGAISGFFANGSVRMHWRKRSEATWFDGNCTGSKPASRFEIALFLEHRIPDVFRNIDSQGVRKINSRQAGKKVPDYLENNVVRFVYLLRSEGVRIGNSEVIARCRPAVCLWKTGEG